MQALVLNPKAIHKVMLPTVYNYVLCKTKYLVL